MLSYGGFGKGFSEKGEEIASTSVTDLVLGSNLSALRAEIGFFVFVSVPRVDSGTVIRITYHTVPYPVFVAYRTVLLLLTHGT